MGYLHSSWRWQGSIIMQVGSKIKGLNQSEKPDVRYIVLLITVTEILSKVTSN